MELKHKSKSYTLDHFDSVLVTCCDIQGVPRGRFMFRHSVPGFMKNGLGMAQAAMFCGIKCDIPVSITEYLKNGWANGTLMPDVATLRPMSWLSNERYQVGHMVCDLLDETRELEVSASRHLARQQIDALTSLGYSLLISLNLEVTIFHKGTLEPVHPYEDTSNLEIALLTYLSESGLPIVSVGKGMEPGQLVISVGNQLGIEAADSLHYLHCVLKSLCVQQGYDVTWMTKSLPGIIGNKTSYNFTLKATNNNRNVFSDGTSQSNLSALASHWIAGLLHHNASLAALVRPTLSCYSSIDDSNTFENNWTFNEQDRKHRLQVRRTESDIVITDRLPSSASNPYTVTASLVAAGIDGVTNKLELKEKTKASFQLENRTPASLSEALLSLETDKSLSDLIGHKFIHRYLLLKREYEVSRFENRKSENNYQDDLGFEQSLYLLTP